MTADAALARIKAMFPCNCTGSWSVHKDGDEWVITHLHDRQGTTLAASARVSPRPDAADAE
jgi:hypothetical protein